MWANAYTYYTRWLESFVFAVPVPMAKNLRVRCYTMMPSARVAHSCPGPSSLNRPHPPPLTGTPGFHRHGLYEMSLRGVQAAPLGHQRGLLCVLGTLPGRR